jgi:hypothetical protein
MELVFDKFDGRRNDIEDVTDKDTGRYISSNGTFSGGGMDVILFDGNYKATLNSYEACLGFVKGVEAVLNHLLLSKKKSASAKVA